MKQILIEADENNRLSVATKPSLEDKDTVALLFVAAITLARQAGLDRRRALSDVWVSDEPPQDRLHVRP